MLELLVPLRIPSGWTVLSNSFYDIEMLIDGGSFKNSSDFPEDMLLIRRDVPDGWKEKYLIDLSWVPSRSPHGSYRLTLLLESWEQILSTFSSRDRRVIQERLNTWLAILSRETSVEAALQCLEALQT